MVFHILNFWTSYAKLIRLVQSYYNLIYYTCIFSQWRTKKEIFFKPKLTIQKNKKKQTKKKKTKKRNKIKKKKKKPTTTKRIGWNWVGTLFKSIQKCPSLLVSYNWSIRTWRNRGIKISFKFKINNEDKFSKLPKCEDNERKIKNIRIETIYHSLPEDDKRGLLKFISFFLLGFIYNNCHH